MTTPQKIYREAVQELSQAERLQLAALILNGLAGPGVSSVTASAEDEIGRLYDEIARLSETAASEPSVQKQLRAAWSRLRELQSQEAHVFRRAFEASLTMPLDAGRQILTEAKALVGDGVITLIPKQTQSKEGYPFPEPARESPTFAELVAAQGVQPVESFDDIRGGWPEDELNDGFETAVRQWRDDELRPRDA
jgi:hypothetical protein